MKYVKYIPLVLFVAHFSKLSILGKPTWIDGLILLVLGVFSFLYNYFDQTSEVTKLLKTVADHEAKFVELDEKVQKARDAVGTLKVKGTYF